MNFISQLFYYESSQLNPQNQKTWLVSAMALMSFLDTIPECTDLIGILGTYKFLLMPLTLRHRDALLLPCERSVSKSSLIMMLVNIVKTGFQFNEICFGYFEVLKRFQTHMFLITLIRQPTLFPFLGP